MAKDSSFDVVSEVNMQEVDNAFQQTTREISQRYDLKDSGATIELSKGDKLFTINAPADFVSKQIIDVLSSAISSMVSTRRPPRRSTRTSRIKSSRSR